MWIHADCSMVSTWLHPKSAWAYDLTVISPAFEQARRILGQPDSYTWEKLCSIHTVLASLLPRCWQSLGVRLILCLCILNITCVYMYSVYNGYTEVPPSLTPPCVLLTFPLLLPLAMTAYHQYSSLSPDTAHNTSYFYGLGLIYFTHGQDNW